MPPWIAIAIALLVSAGPVGAQAVDPLPPRAGRLIVKYRSSVAQCAHCLLARHVPFSTVTGSDSLDQLHARFGVRAAKGLFFADDHGSDRASHYHRSQDDARRRFPARAAREPRSATRPDLSNVFVLELGADADPVAAAAAFARDPNVEYAEPDASVAVSLTPSDPFFGTSGSFGQSFPDLWGLRLTDAQHAWDVANGSGMVVAVVDTGVSTNHPDLKANLWTNSGEIPRNHIDDDGNGYVDDVLGWDFVKNKNKVKDGNGHGTHVAGTIAASGNNGIGVIGMAWGARLMTVRGLDERGRGYTSDLAKAIQYATDNGADVINNSWGGGRSQVVEDAVAAATSQGVVVVFAAGNDNAGYSGSASAPGAIAVAATQHDDTRASFSNYGPYVSVAAPGVQILSTRGASRVGGTKVGGKYSVLSGTSMAAPHVAGLAAVLLSAQPTLTVDEVRWHLELNADQPGWPGYEGQRFNPFFGYGRINAARVFDPPPTTTRITTPATTFHTLEGTTRTGALSLDFAFTTNDPVPWSITGAPWLVPDFSNGSGDASVPCTLDATALGPGSVGGSLTLAAPTTVDGGGSVTVAAHVHHDGRAGEPFVLSEPPRAYADAPAGASDGQGDFFAWVAWPASGSPDLVGAYVAADGAITGPFLIDAGFCESDLCQVKLDTQLAVTFDGSAFLVAWGEELREYPYVGPRRRHDIVKAVRVSAAGQLLAAPVTLVENVENASSDNSYDEYFFNLYAASDGAGTVVLWGQIDWSQTYAKAFHYWTRRVDLSGNAPAAAHQIYPTSDTASPQFIQPRIACLTANATCLVAWHEADGEIGSNGHYVDKIVGKRFVGDAAIDATPRQILRDGETISGLIAGNGQFLGTTYRRASCGTAWCDQAVAARMSSDGTALDPDGVVLNNAGPEGLPTGSFAGPLAAAFDGTNYWVTWGEVADHAATTEPTCYPFAARIGAAGGVLDVEPSGLLLTASPLRCALQTLTISGDRSLLAWIERPDRIIVQPGVVP